MSEKTNLIPYTPEDGNDEEGNGVAPEPCRVMWSYVKTNGEIEECFEPELALAALLIAERAFLNSRHWKATDKESIIVFINCNDIFAWGCSDAQEVLFHELQDLYEHHVKDPDWGTSVWCIKKRGEMPQKPVYNSIKKQGIWNLDMMGLRKNTTDDRQITYLPTGLTKDK